MEDEAKVLREQLDELLGEGASDPEDALEIASVAGMLARLDGPLADAETWLAGPGGPLLEELWREIDLLPLVEAIEAVSMGDGDEDAVETALFDLDEVVAAAVWSGHRQRVVEAAQQAAAHIRSLPDAFASFADIGRQMARSRAVGGALDVYDFWLAVADAGEWTSG